MLARPKKKELTTEQREAITQASSKQTGSMTSPKTYDPNFPLFDVPVNQKVLVYIPNHTIVGADGSVELRQDRFAAHTCRIGQQYIDVRCSGEVVNEALGYDGSCPICNAMAESWKLYGYQWKKFCETRGLDPDDDTIKEQFKDDRKKLMDEMSVTRPTIYKTFPIVVVECEEGKTVPKKDASGKLIGHPMFYTVAETTYIDKWEAAFDSLDDTDDAGDRTPAGRWAILNFTYTPKSGTHNKRDSARNLKVTFKTMPAESYGDWEKYFDQLTQEWTPEKAQDVLVKNAIRDMDEMNDATVEIMKSTREKLARIELDNNGVTTVAPTNVDADATLQSFGAVPSAPATVAPTSELPMGEMPNANVQ